MQYYLLVLVLSLTHFFQCAPIDVDAHETLETQHGQDTPISPWIIPMVEVEDAEQGLAPREIESGGQSPLVPLVHDPACQDTLMGKTGRWMGQEGHHYHLYSKVDLSLEIGQRDIALMTVYLPHKNFRPNTVPYLQGLQQAGWQVVLIVNTAEKEIFQSPQLRTKLVEQSGAEVVLFRDNLGYDFGGWFDALQLMPYLWLSQLLVFTNDSMLGPVNIPSLQSVHRRMLESPSEVVYLTESVQTEHHYQSYFFGLKPTARARPETIRFFCHIEPWAQKREVVNFLEFGLSRYWLQHQIPIEVLFPICDTMDCCDKNPTHQLWQELLQQDFPFLKMDLVRAFRADAPATYCEIGQMTSALGYAFQVFDPDYPRLCGDHHPSLTRQPLTDRSERLD